MKTRSNKYQISEEKCIELSLIEYCAICGIHKNDVTRGLVVDHEHSSNKVRGMLCDNCNLAIGLSKDNVETLRKIIKYLERTNL